MSWADDYATAGARYLDEQDHGWADRINLGDFDMEDPCGCILGQLTGDFHDALREFGWDLHQAALLGFTIPSGYTDTDENWAGLDQAWVNEVLSRRAPAEVTR